MSQQQAVRVISDIEQASAIMAPLRLKLLDKLSEPESATGLARILGEPRQKINYHLRELERAGLVEFVREQRKGNCMERIVQATARSYLISPALLGSLGESEEEIMDRFSSTYLVAVLANALKDVALLREAAQDQSKRLPTFTMQTDVTFAHPDDRNSFASELSQCLAGLVAKYHSNDADGRSFRFVVGSFPEITREDLKEKREKM